MLTMCRVESTSSERVVRSFIRPTVAQNQLTESDNENNQSINY